jgi:hypothetical protein
MYLMTKTRPDLAYSIGLLARYMANPGLEHWKALEKLWSYIWTTSKLGLTYQSTSNDPIIIGYTDADWGGDISTRRSTTGYLYLFLGASLSWTSKLQRTVALSSCEAEYMAIKETIKENLYIQGILQELEPYIGFIECGNIYTDSNSAIQLAKNPVFHNRTKHIDIQYHFIRETVKTGKIGLKFIPTEQQLANVLTKAVDYKEISIFRDKAGIKPIQA